MRTSARSLWLWLVAASLSLSLASAASAVTIDWVSVGGPLNACDVQGSNCFGTVASAYQISKYEVTNAQYAEFLNAKAGALDPLALYNADMNPVAGLNGGITQSGSTYTAVAGRENLPVNFVSFYDTLRFTNWLNNGQGAGDTESGAYLLLGGTATPTNGPIVTRSVGAAIFLPSENEWYKAAYYDVGSASYNTDPFADGLAAVCESPGTTTHSANCDFPVGSSDLTNVGSYTGASPNGTYDQGGNVFEWTEGQSSGNRVLRGGSFLSPSAQLAAASQSAGNPGDAFKEVGFRVATSVIPEPGTGLLVMVGVLGLAGWRRRRA
jgi:formylglycine-generating enzyme required for sulfatase activity